MDSHAFKSVSCLDVEPSIQHALKKAHLGDQGNILRLSNEALVMLTRLSNKEVECLKEKIAVNFSPMKPHCTGLDLIMSDDCNSLQQWKLSTRCSQLDKVLKGGLPSGVLTEVTGESASGKTQICLQLCISVQTTGPVPGGAAYICTEDAFPSKRLQEMIRHISNSDESASKRVLGDNIFIEHVADFDALDYCVKYKLPVLLNQRGVRLVIIDSVTALFRCQYDVHQTVERAVHLNSFSCMMHKLASQHNIPIVSVNQVSSSMSEGGSGLTPALGLAWANQVSCRLMLAKPSPAGESRIQKAHKQFSSSALRTYRIFNVVFSPHAPMSEIPVFIDHSGMHGFVI